MITLVNSARIKAGQSTVGWLNPALYAFHRNFTNDVTKGHNKCGADNVVRTMMSIFDVYYCSSIDVMM